MLVKKLVFTWTSSDLFHFLFLWRSWLSPHAHAGAWTNHQTSNMALVTLAACSLGFAGLRLPPNSVVAETRTALASVQMQLPNIGDMGSKFMNQMGLGDGAGLGRTGPWKVHGCQATYSSVNGTTQSSSEMYQACGREGNESG